MILMGKWSVLNEDLQPDPEKQSIKKLSKVVNILTSEWNYCNWILEILALKPVY